MKTGNMNQSVLELLHREHATPLSPADIATELRLQGARKKRLQKSLQELTVRGDIVRIRGNRYSVGAEADLVTGRVEMSRGGDGFVNGPGGQCEAFVPRGMLSTALPGDRVVVRLGPGVTGAPAGDRGREGHVIRILERAQREIVGTLRSTDRFHYVVPMDPRYKKDFYVPGAGGAALGDRVIIRFAAWDDPHLNPEAEVVEVIGPADNPSTDTVAVLRHFGIQDQFPGVVLNEAETAGGLMQRPGERLDLSRRLLLTIDPERARDFDDALSLERDEKGRRVLGVHIADVSHFVRPGTRLDEEARRRGTSVYLPDAVVPMLPEQLSNGVCSLRPNVSRLAFSAFLALDDTGHVVGAEFARTCIESRLRLTYEQVLPVLHGKSDPAIDVEAARLLRELHELAQQMRKLRFRHHAMELETVECSVQVDGDGNVTGIGLTADDESHQLVGECMIAANEAVARELSDAAVPTIYRVHASPSREKMTELAAELAGLGYQPGDLTQRRNLARFLKSIKGDPRAGYVRLAVLKSLNRAEYSEVRSEHFGLAKEFYGHFTSPIRRYPDLAVHRQLGSLIDSRAAGGRRSKRSRYDAAALGEIARTSSDAEQRAEQAERTLTELKKYRYLKAQLDSGEPETYDAVVVNVMNFGLFVEVPDLQVQGLVHVSQISDRFVRHSRKQRSLRAGSKRYSLESQVRVRVIGVDIENRKLDFELAR